MTAHELQAQSQQQSSVDWRNDPAAQHLAREIENADSINDLRDDWGSLSKELSFKQLRRLQRHPKELKSFIADEVRKRDDIGSNFTLNPGTGFYDAKSEKISEATNQIVGDIQGKLMHDVKSRIAEKALGNVENAIELNQMINQSPKSRRRFLANLASRLDSQKQMKTALVEKGFEAGDAESISNTLTELQNDPSKLDAFLDPSKSPERFDRAAETLKQHYDSEISDLKELEDRIDSDQANPWNQGRKLLTDPNYKFARRDVFEELDIDPDLADGSLKRPASGAPDYENGLTRLVDNEMSDAESAETTEKWANTGITAAAGLATAGFGSALAVGLGTAAASNAPEIMQAYQDVSVAESAKNAGLTDHDQVQSARAKRDTAIYSAVFDVALAGAGDEAFEGMNEFQKTIVQEGIKEGTKIPFERLDRNLREGLEN